MADTSIDLTQELQALDGLLQIVGGPALLEIITEQTHEMWADAVSRAPVGQTGNYKAGIHQKVFDDPDGPKGTVFVVPGPWDRHPGTKAPANLGLWLEYGHLPNAPAFPHLTPALTAAQARTDRAIQDKIEQAASA